MRYQVNIETCWIAGLWGADRGALAKGVVAIVNTTPELLENFHEFSLRNFDITESKFRRRIIRGFGESQEVYFTRLPVRRFIEELLSKREKLNKKNSLAYLAGRFDGDGNVSSKSSSLCIFYNFKEKEDAKTDKRILENLGFNVALSEEPKIIRLRILKPRYFASKLIKYNKHKKKTEHLKLLVSKRLYRS